MAVWPSTLPNPQRTGYKLSPADQTERSNMEVGAPRSRRITAARNDQTPVIWIFTDTQMAVFRSWFDDATTGIAGGASWFNGMSIPLGDGGFASPDCRFIGPFSATPIGAPLVWTVTAKLETR